MKYRRNKVKREHGIIEDALMWLEDLSRNPAVTDIIPGVIEVSRSPERGIVYKYETQTGCKLLLKSNGSIQEAFVVTKNPSAVQQWVETHFPTASGGRPETIKKTNKNKGEKQQFSSPRSKVKSHRDLQYNQKFANELSTGDLEAPNLGELISRDTRRKLRDLQKILSSDSRKTGKNKH